MTTQRHPRLLQALCCVASAGSRARACRQPRLHPRRCLAFACDAGGGSASCDGPHPAHHCRPSRQTCRPPPLPRCRRRCRTYGVAPCACCAGGVAVASRHPSRTLQSQTRYRPASVVCGHGGPLSCACAPSSCEALVKCGWCWAGWDPASLRCRAAPGSCAAAECPCARVVFAGTRGCCRPPLRASWFLAPTAPGAGREQRR